jgi:hypothetical protein
MLGVGPPTISSLSFGFFIVLNNIASACSTEFDASVSAGIRSLILTHRSAYRAPWGQFTNVESLVA